MAAFEVGIGASALSEWAALPTRKARLAAHRALSELQEAQFPRGSFRLVGDPVWRLVRDDVLVLYVATERGCFVTHIRPRR